MEEKHMVNDILESSKNEIKNYSNIIVETDNMELRQLFQTIRSNTESFQYELFKLATSKGYYTPAEPVKPEEINKMRNILENLG